VLAVHRLVLVRDVTRELLPSLLAWKLGVRFALSVLMYPAAVEGKVRALVLPSPRVIVSPPP